MISLCEHPERGHLLDGVVNLCRLSIPFLARSWMASRPSPIAAGRCPPSGLRRRWNAPRRNRQDRHPSGPCRRAQAPPSWLGCHPEGLGICVTCGTHPAGGCPPIIACGSAGGGGRPPPVGSPGGIIRHRALPAVGTGTLRRWRQRILDRRSAGLSCRSPCLQVPPPGSLLQRLDDTVCRMRSISAARLPLLSRVDAEV